MVNKMQQALIKKEMRGVVKTNRFFVDYLLLPLIMALIFPIGGVLMVVLMDSSTAEFEQMMAVMMISLPAGGEDLAIIQMLINNIMPTFFLMIPAFTVSVIASSSFTGEKERRTLETLLYSPMRLKEIFTAKVLVAFFVGMIVTMISFVMMMVLVTGLVWVLLGELFIPGWIWLVILGIVGPAFAFLGIIIQVRVSAKAQKSEDAYQRGAVLVLPLVLLMISQFTGILLISAWMFAILGVILAGLAWVLIKTAFRKFTYEELLKG